VFRWGQSSNGQASGDVATTRSIVSPLSRSRNQRRLDYGLVSLSIVAWGALLEFLEVAAVRLLLEQGLTGWVPGF